MRRQAIGDWKQFLAIVLMGAIAMTLFVGLISNAQSLSERVNAFYTSSSVPDAWVVTNKYEIADENYVRSLLEEGDTFDKRFQITAKLESSSAYCIVSEHTPTLSHPVEVLDKDETLTDDDFFYIDRALWAKQGSKDLKLDVGVEATFSINVGSYLNLTESMATFLDNLAKPGVTPLHRRNEVSMKSTVNGVMTFGENIQVASYYPSAFLMSKNRFADAFNTVLNESYTDVGVTMIKAYLGNDIPPMNEYLVKLKDTNKLGSFEQQVRDYFKNKAESGGTSNLVEVLDRGLNPWSIAAETEIQEATQLTFVFPMVFFFVALLVILTTASQIIIKERTQIGTLKAIGLSKREVYLHYLSLIFSLTTLSSIVGCIVGPLLIPFIMARKYNILYTLPSRNLFVFPWWQALLAYLVFVGLAMLVAFFSCRKEVKLSPSESMRASPVSYHSLVKPSPKKPRSAGLLSIKMAFRNILVSKYKSLMVIVGVLGCTALLVCGFGIDDTLSHSVDNDLSFFYTSDVYADYSLVVQDEVPAYANDPRVKSYEQYLKSTVKIHGESLSMSGSLYLLSETHPNVKVDIPEGTVAISKKVENELNIHVGDTVVVDRNGVSYSKKIGTVYEAFITHGVMAPRSMFPDITGYNAAFVHAADGVDASLAKLAVTEAMGSKIDQCKTRQDMRNQINSIMSGISLMTTAVKTFAVALAVVVLYNLALLNFRERTRDIATMKVLGFSLVEISLSLIFETLTLTLVGSLLGLVVGFPFMYAVLYVNRVALVEFLYFIFPKTYLIAFGLTFLVSLVVNLYLGFLTRKVKMVESLKSVE